MSTCYIENISDIQTISVLEFAKSLFNKVKPTKKELKYAGDIIFNICFINNIKYTNDNLVNIR